jgi:hypothetical protein
MVPVYHAQASPDCDVSCIPVAVLVHDDIPIAELLVYTPSDSDPLKLTSRAPKLSPNTLTQLLPLTALSISPYDTTAPSKLYPTNCVPVYEPTVDDDLSKLSADDRLDELIASFMRTQNLRVEPPDLQRCESYDSTSSGSSCSTPSCFSSNTSDSEDSSHKGSSRSRAGGQLSAAKTELTKKSRPKCRIPLTKYQIPILQNYKESKKLVMPDGETYQGEYVPKGPELEDLTRRTGLTESQVRGSLQTAATLPGLD